MENGFVTLSPIKKEEPLSSQVASQLCPVFCVEVLFVQEEQVLQDKVISDHSLMPKLRDEFIEEMNKMIALAAHGPM